MVEGLVLHESRERRVDLLHSVGSELATATACPAYPRVMDERARALECVKEMTDKQFVEFVYSAVQGRRRGPPVEEVRTLFVVASVDIEGGDAAIYVTALPESTEAWVDDALICQEGTCGGCSLQLESWAKNVRCPACGSTAYLT